MIWLAWRQLRVPATIVLAALAIVVVLLLVTQQRVVDNYETSGVADCAAGDEPSGAETCGDIERRFLADYRPLPLIGDLVGFAPALIGAFWGAPLLARELEVGTHRLVWTQSITRSRWLGTKLAVVGGLGVVVTAVCSLLFTWWAEPLDRIGGRIGPGTFAERGIAPAAYVALAFVLGVAIGTLIRRTLPAMAALLGGFVLLRFGIQAWVRPRLVAPEEVTYPTYSFFAPDPPGLAEAERGWVLSGETLDRAGNVIGSAGQPLLDETVMELCGRSELRATKEILDECGQQLGLHDVVSFHPADRFWVLQGWETAFVVGLTLALAAICFWWIRRA
jgi:hypothetical protein